MLKFVVAIIFVVPRFFAITIPSRLTLAMLGSFDLNVIVGLGLACGYSNAYSRLYLSPTAIESSSGIIQNSVFMHDI